MEVRFEEKINDLVGVHLTRDLALSIPQQQFFNCAIVEILFLCLVFLSWYGLLLLLDYRLRPDRP
jgi:hypothetical protein